MKRLRKGLNVILSLQAQGAALYQGYNDTTGAVLPDWTQKANQPIVVPTATASDGSTATITNGAWTYNGTQLTIGSTVDSDGYATCTNNTAFAINTTTWALKIIKNLASASNTQNDTLMFTCSGEAGGVSYEAAASVTVHLQQIGSSAAAVYISGTNVLSTTNPTGTLKAHFFVDGAEQTTGYWMQWKGEDGTTLDEGQLASHQTYTVTRADITAIGGIYAYVSRGTAAAGAQLASDFHTVTDLADEYELTVVVDKEWNGTDAQKVYARLYKFENGKTTENVSSKLTASNTSFELRTSVSDTTITTKSGSSVTAGGTDGAYISVADDVWSKVPEDEDVVAFVTVNM